MAEQATTSAVRGWWAKLETLELYKGEELVAKYVSKDELLRAVQALNAIAQKGLG